MATGPGPYVFVSHAREDAEAVRRLVRVLEDASFQVAQDLSSQGPPAGVNLVEELERTIDLAAAVLVVWSEGSVISEWVQHEAALGRDAGKLVMVRIDLAQVPPVFRDEHAFDLTGWDGDAGDARLRSMIERLVTVVTRVQLAAEASPTSEHLDLDEFSATVRGVRGELTGPVTSSAIAAALATRHPEYAGGLLSSVQFTTDGEVADIDEWLRRVRRLYVIEEVAASRHEVISGRLLLAGLSLLDPVLAASLEASGARSRLLAELDVLPRRPDDSSSADVGFATDLVGEGRPLRAADDVLGIEDDVRTLCRLVMARSTSPPLAVGLFGDWGTGKSFFLQRMRTRIVEMSDEAKTSAIGLGTCERVIQVTFNAWHYLDADLWASLANRLYQGIAGSPLAAEEFRRRMFEELASTKDVRVRAQRDGRQATDELATAERALADRTQKLAELRNGRLTPTDAAGVVGLAVIAEPDIAAAQGTTVGELAADARFGHGLVRRVLRETSWLTKVLAMLAVLLTAGAAWALFSLGWAGRVAAFVPPIVAAGVAWVTGFRDALHKVRVQAGEWQRLREEADARLRSEVEELRAQIAAAKVTQRQADETLTELRDGGLVRRYLVERAQSAAYRDRLGLVSLVREDLEALVQLLDPVSGDRLGSRIDRIVLYVDDLDRCPPARVVEVLQAVHLLLAFPLFVVVVAVDARWLITSLELHYRELLGHDSSGVTFADWELTPSNYLEKIFQIPFVLRPMSPEGYGRLVRRLAPVRAQEIERRDDLPADPEPDLAAAEGTTNVAPAAAPEVREPAVLLQTPLPGMVLGLRFSVDGQWLVAVTTEGVWRWERSRTDLLLEHGGGAVMAAISPGARVVVTFADDGWLCVLDMATGEVHRELLAPDRQPQELAAADTGAVVGATAAGQLVWLAGDAVGGAEVQNPKAHDLHLTADGRSLVWREGRDGNDVRVATGADTWGFGEGIQGLALSRDGELLTWSSPTTVMDEAQRHLRQEWEVDAEIISATAPVYRTPHYQRSLPVIGLLAGRTARALGGWWALQPGDPGWYWPDDGEPTQAGFLLGGERIAGDPQTPLVVSWGGGGFQVADSTGVRYEASRDLPVDLAAVSPLGRLVATVGAGELRLWEVAGSGAPEQPSQLELEPEEAGFLVDLAPLVDTPRMAKRLVNVYRLLRASAAGRVGLSDPATGDYRVALVLLALVVAHPRLAEEVFVELGESVSPTWPELVTDLLAKPGVDLGPELEAERTAVLNGVLALSADPTPSPIELFRSWGEHASRFHVAPR